MLGEEYKLRNSSLCSFLHPPVTSSLFGPNILLSTLFSTTPSLNDPQSLSIIAWCRFVLEKPAVPETIKKLHVFYEKTRGPLPCSQKLGVRFSPRPH
jgi:hypothetical protein